MLFITLGLLKYNINTKFQDIIIRIKFNVITEFHHEKFTAKKSNLVDVIVNMLLEKYFNLQFKN